MKNQISLPSKSCQQFQPFNQLCLLSFVRLSLRGRRFKGMGKGVLGAKEKGVLGARETRGGARPNSLPFPFERLPRRLC